MKTAPTLHTERLILRSFTLEDAADVQRLASDPGVASTTDVMERPGEDETAEEWIQWCHKEREKGTIASFADHIEDRQSVHWYGRVDIPASPAL